jgi:hypothetical protein
MTQFQPGIALRKTRSLKGRICYEIVEANASGDHSLALRADDRDIIALWRSMARDKNLPLLIEHGDGHREPVHQMIGGITLGPHRPQRRALLTRVF